METIKEKSFYPNNTFILSIHQGLFYVETSAKSADGVDDAFLKTAEAVWDKMKNGSWTRKNTNLGDDRDKVTLGQGKSPYGRKKCCS